MGRTAFKGIGDRTLAFFHAGIRARSSSAMQRSRWERTLPKRYTVLRTLLNVRAGTHKPVTSVGSCLLLVFGPAVRHANMAAVFCPIFQLVVNMLQVRFNRTRAIICAASAVALT